MSDKRHRVQHRFWLDAMNDDDLLLMEEIDDMKAKRSFTDTVRDGLRLMSSLRKGEVGVLLELFPDIRQLLQLPSVPSTGGGGELRKLESKLDAIQTALLQQQAPAGLLMAAKDTGGAGNAKSLTAKTLAMPTFDDDDDLIVATKRKSDGGQSATNFLNALGSL